MNIFCPNIRGKETSGELKTYFETDNPHILDK
jgi:hypothetical protein